MTNELTKSSKEEAFESLNSIEITDASYTSAGYKQQLGRVKRIKLSDVEIGLFHSTHLISGRPKTAWTMKLMREPSKCRLPRGFSKSSSMSV